MNRKTRDFRREYLRRLERGRARGLTTSQARGHAKAGEQWRKSESSADPRGPEESALKMMKHGATLKEAARAHRVSQERLRRYLHENTQANYRGRKWSIIDTRRFHLPIYSRGRIVQPWLSAEEASKAGRYLAAVGRFLPTGNAAHLDPFRGQGVKDLSGVYHPFETRENTLYRLDTAGELSIPEIYKIQG
jgi:hypothetical protein